MNTVRYRERLIDEVKKFPVLYDTKHEQHRDIDVRDRCWQEISLRLGGNSDALKREWKILRDSMRQALKRSKEGATTRHGEPCKKWRFQSRMAFILPYVTVRRRRELKQHIKLDSEEVEGGAGLEGAGAAEDGAGAGDALDLFFGSVCASSKRLPRALQRDLKRRVLAALLAVEELADSAAAAAAAADGPGDTSNK